VRSLEVLRERDSLENPGLTLASGMAGRVRGAASEENESWGGGRIQRTPSTQP
jgi:hypothetical protein